MDTGRPWLRTSIPESQQTWSRGLHSVSRSVRPPLSPFNSVSLGLLPRKGSECSLFRKWEGETEAMILTLKGAEVPRHPRVGRCRSDGWEEERPLEGNRESWGLMETGPSRLCLQLPCELPALGIKTIRVSGFTSRQGLKVSVPAGCTPPFGHFQHFLGGHQREWLGLC